MTDSKIKAWGHSLRLRTLPLSISGTIVAGAIAASKHSFRWDVFVLMILTAALLQILSNMANDYGDYTKGTDNDGRIGPRRALQSGAISSKEFLVGTLAVCGLTMMVGLALVLSAFGLQGLLWVVVFLLLGAASILAAVKYTVGRKAYGYMGMGEVFVFIFFGLVSVTGGLFLFIHSVDVYSLLPAAGIGLMASAVLNLNNMRDVDNDRAMGKKTIASYMSIAQGKIYQAALLLGAMTCFLVYQYLTYHTDMWYVVCAVCLINVYVTMGVKKRVEFDKYLKVVSMSTFLLAIVFSIAINI